MSVPRYAHGSRVPGWDRAVDLSKDPAEIPDPATTPVPSDLRTEIEAHMAKYPDRRSAALPALAAAQRRHGWCSPEAIEQVACVMRLTPGYLTAVATFYDMLDTEPVGRHRVYVCTNISCSLNGADALYDRFVEATDGDGDFEVRHFECLGACDIAPMASFDGVYVGPIELDEVRTLLDQVRNGEPPLPDKQMARRMSTDPRANSRDFPRPAEPQRAVAQLPDQRRAVVERQRADVHAVHRGHRGDVARAQALEGADVEVHVVAGGVQHGLVDLVRPAQRAGDVRAHVDRVLSHRRVLEHVVEGRHGDQIARRQPHRGGDLDDRRRRQPAVMALCGAQRGDRCRPEVRVARHVVLDEGAQVGGDRRRREVRDDGWILVEVDGVVPAGDARAVLEAPHQAAEVPRQHAHRSTPPSTGSSIASVAMRSAM